MAKKPKKAKKQTIQTIGMKTLLSTDDILIEAVCSKLDLKGKAGKNKIWVKWTTNPTNDRGKDVGSIVYTSISCGHKNMLNLLLWLSNLVRKSNDKHYQRMDAFEVVHKSNKRKVNERFLRSDYKDAKSNELMCRIEYKIAVYNSKDPTAKPYIASCEISAPKADVEKMGSKLQQIINICC